MNVPGTQKMYVYLLPLWILIRFKIPSILPVIHGTALATAWKICATGFANLSCLDDGFFGKGIYFTTYALYALPYFAYVTSFTCFFDKLLVRRSNQPWYFLSRYLEMHSRLLKILKDLGVVLGKYTRTNKS
jgi:hypothetical protein